MIRKISKEKRNSFVRYKSLREPTMENRVFSRLSSKTSHMVKSVNIKVIMNRRIRFLSTPYVQFVLRVFVIFL